jgi:His-Xaa-Ser system radical SAM maturase HxsB
MTRFRPLEHYDQSPEYQYTLLPFNFTKLDDRDYVMTNMAGEHVVADRKTIDSLVRHSLSKKTETFRALKSKHFVMDADSTVSIDLLTLKTRTKLQEVAEFTGLHIFVVTLRCEHACPYCQVSRQSDDCSAFDMALETANAALNLVFQSPSRSIKIEFQGGESMLNFPLVEHIVAQAESRNQKEKRDLQFVLATNLALVSDEILKYCAEHAIVISTSLDGPADLHNVNRPRPGRDSHARAVEGIHRARAILGKDRVGALMTTTQASLGRVRNIIDEYVALEFSEIFLRPLSPYGFAVKTKAYSTYDTEDWLKFYFEGLEYIIELNRSGTFFREVFATIILQKMLTPFGTGYVDLRSPAGIGIGAIVYNYDGDVYASDESRMLAEMGDTTFRIGNVHNDTWQAIMTSEKLLAPLEESFAASAPMCAECAFEPFCGAEPVFHHATQGDWVGHKPSSSFCNRNMAIFRYLIKAMRDDAGVRAILTSWISR